MQKAKYHLSIKVTKTFDQHDRCNQRLFKGVKTLKSHGAEASYCEAVYKSKTWFAFCRLLWQQFEPRHRQLKVGHRMALSFQTTS